MLFTQFVENLLRKMFITFISWNIMLDSGKKHLFCITWFHAIHSLTYGYVLEGCRVAACGKD